MIIYSFFILTFATAIITAVPSEFSLKGDPCSKHDSCYSKPALRTCSCDNDCHMYRTCCHDLKKPQHDSSEVEFRCYHRRTATPVFAKRSCSDDFRGHVADRLTCFDNDEDEMDVKNNLLVTSHKTKITYWNKHCAICSNEAKEDLELWNIEVYCPPNKDVNRNLIRRNLTFDQDKRQWGLQIDDEFLLCIVKYSPPPYIDEVKHCTPNLISSCPANYTNEDIVMKCSQYYAERRVKNSDTYYKNIHCAVCNDIDVTQLECSGMYSPEEDIEESDFKKMVEQVFSKGDWLEREPSKEFECSKGYSYDVTRGKCRTDESLTKTSDVPPNSSHTFRNEYLTMLSVLFALSFLIRIKL